MLETSLMHAIIPFPKRPVTLVAAAYLCSNGLSLAWNFPHTELHTLCLLNRLAHLDHRSCIHSPSPDKIVDETEDNNGPRHQNGVIHILSSDGLHRWPKAEENHHGQIATCVCIVGDTPVSRYTPRSPIEFRF